MKQFLDKFGQWLRHKIRVVIIKQWKKPKWIYINLQRLNKLQMRPYISTRIVLSFLSKSRAVHATEGEPFNKGKR